MIVAEPEGVEALSMRKVAAHLGVGAATLYTYVPDKAALPALMADEMTGQAPPPLTREHLTAIRDAVAAASGEAANR